MYGPQYVWMMPGFYQRDWFVKVLNESQVNCTSNQIQEVIEGYVAFKNELLPVSDEKPLAGYVSMINHISK